MARRCFTSPVQLELFLARAGLRPLEPEWIEVAGRQVPLRFVPNPNARRYILRLDRDGVARVTIPSRGSLKQAREFAAKNADWIGRQFLNRATATRNDKAWGHGTGIFFRGGRVRLSVDGGRITFADQAVTLGDTLTSVRRAVESHLLELAGRELFDRTAALAKLHGFVIRKVWIRNQRSRWGSSSTRGTIALNWRLVQMPESVRDYIILHELAHQRVMNHSDRFWQEVERLCPAWREAEAWLKKHERVIRHALPAE